VISKRTLEKWRKEALTEQNNQNVVITSRVIELSNRIIKLTGELLDQDLLRRG